MANEMKDACDAVLSQTMSGRPGVPGVVAMATDRDGVIYQGAAGVRRWDTRRR